jgi:hypothetical protein
VTLGHGGLGVCGAAAGWCHEFVTAPFPVPAGYKPILQPEFPWGYFE